MKPAMIAEQNDQLIEWTAPEAIYHIRTGSITAEHSDDWLGDTCYQSSLGAVLVTHLVFVAICLDGPGVFLFVQPCCQEVDHRHPANGNDARINKCFWIRALWLGWLGHNSF